MKARTGSAFHPRESAAHLCGSWQVATGNLELMNRIGEHLYRCYEILCGNRSARGEFSVLLNANYLTSDRVSRIQEEVYENPIGCRSTSETDLANSRSESADPNGKCAVPESDPADPWRGRSESAS